MSQARPPRVVFDFGAVLFRWRPAHVVRTVWPHRARTEAELAQKMLHLQDLGCHNINLWHLFDLYSLGRWLIFLSYLALVSVLRMQVLFDYQCHQLCPVVHWWFEARL